ncbi:CLUMA_CG012620, isoform A [Clunio marinus]|uniref:CLUMA_CG012620, isoform A n=1 Tax=Clunio marinus TaxID=568069 RepID=A0A1J1ILW4_9DIPT|nr:CLUMA_CG012620, isoform A [Clunio marinus]
MMPLIRNYIRKFRRTSLSLLQLCRKD